MNEHIIRLMEQATVQEGSHGAFGEPTTNEYVDLEKFAELIVLECAAYLNGPAEVYNQNEQDVCDRNARLIKQYFGIK